jgi:hypothetical protein
MTAAATQTTTPTMTPQFRRIWLPWVGW